MMKGDRVQLHPATDLWMRGARYGTLKRIYMYNGEEVADVYVDAIHKVRRFYLYNVMPLD